MNNMIELIIKADNEAKAMEEASLKEKDQILKQIDAETDKTYQKFMNDALEKIKSNNSLEEKNTQAKLSEIEKKYTSAQIKLESDFNHNCNNWVDAIVNRVLN